MEPRRREAQRVPVLAVIRAPRSPVSATPPSAIRGRIDALDPDSIRRLASQLGLGFTALVEHLYNVDLIDEVQREDLRST